MWCEYVRKFRARPKRNHATLSGDKFTARHVSSAFFVYLQNVTSSENAPAGGRKKLQGKAPRTGADSGRDNKFKNDTSFGDMYICQYVLEIWKHISQFKLRLRPVALWDMLYAHTCRCINQTPAAPVRSRARPCANLGYRSATLRTLIMFIAG